MADRKELLDYLRNQQKAAEIDSKVNGVNIWVLIGAIGVVGWQLMSELVKTPAFLDNYYLIATAASVAVALKFLLISLERADNYRNDFRFSRLDDSVIEVPLVMFFFGILSMGPPVFLLYSWRLPFSSLFLAGIGLIFVITGIGNYVSQGIISSPDKWRGFVPMFNTTRKLFIRYSFVTALLSLFALGNIFLSLIRSPLITFKDHANIFTLITIFYFLGLVIIMRKHKNDSIAWTYELETDLVMGYISPDDAAKKIESIKLGGLVERALEDLSQKIDKKIAKLNILILGEKIIKTEGNNLSSENVGKSGQLQIDLYIKDIKINIAELEVQIEKIERQSLRPDASIEDMVGKWSYKKDSFETRLRGAVNELKS